MIGTRRMMRWSGHVVCMLDLRNVYRILVGKLKGRNCLEDLGVDGRIILKWIIRKQGWMVWIRFIWLLIGTCEHSNET
jgi:hypothetical protein